MPEGHDRSALDIDDDDAVQARLDAEADADIAAGRLIPHARMAQWLRSWGQVDEAPPPAAPMR